MRNPSNRLNASAGAPAALPFVSRILSSLRRGARNEDTPRDTQCITVRAKVCEGMRLADLRRLSSGAITVHQVRCRKTSTTRIASPEIRLRQGDLILAEGSRADLDALCEHVGERGSCVDYLKFANTRSLAAHVRGVTPGVSRS